MKESTEHSGYTIIEFSIAGCLAWFLVFLFIKLAHIEYWTWTFTLFPLFIAIGIFLGVFLYVMKTTAIEHSEEFED